MAQKISQMTEQTTASMTEAGTADFLGGYTTTGGNANRKFSLSGLANYFLNKFKMTLGGSSQTVKSAIDTLNSKSFLSRTNPATDFNSFVTPGSYWVRAESLANNPPTTGFGVLEIECYHPNYPDTAIFQRFTCHASPMKSFTRIMTNEAWGAWVACPTRTEIDTAYLLDSPVTEIAANTDLDTITTPGRYRCSLGATVVTLGHCPVAQAFVLTVERGHAPAVRRQTITVENNQGNMPFTRTYTPDVWSSWKQYTDQAQVDALNSKLCAPYTGFSSDFGTINSITHAYTFSDHLFVIQGEISLTNNVAAEECLIKGLPNVSFSNNISGDIFDNHTGLFYKVIINNEGNVISKAALTSGHSIRFSFAYLV